MAPVCGCRCIAAGAVAACGVCVVSETRAGCPSVGGRFGIAGCVGCALSVPPIHRASKRSVLFFMIFRYIGSFVPSVPLPYRAVSAVAAPCIRRRNRGYRTVVSVPPAVPPAVSAVGKFRYGSDAARIAPKRSCRRSDSAAAQRGSFNRTIFGCTISLPSTLRAMTGVKRFRQLVPPFYSAVPRGEAGTFSHGRSGLCRRLRFCMPRLLLVRSLRHVEMRRRLHRRSISGAHSSISRCTHSIPTLRSRSRPSSERYSSQ